MESQPNPYQPPSAELRPGPAGAVEYAGFWIRAVAGMVDTILWLALTLPILLTVYGWDYLLSDRLVAGQLDLLLTWILPVAVVLAFWIARSATPGKMLVRAKIVDAETGAPPTPLQCVGRYAAYIPATLPLGLGILWVAVDPRKQGWHDKLAGTAVVRSRAF